MNDDEIDWEMSTEIPEIDLNIRSEEVTFKSRKLRCADLPAEPSVVDRLAAVADSDAKRRLEDYDRAKTRFDEMLADLRAMWE